MTTYARTEAERRRLVKKVEKNLLAMAKEAIELEVDIMGNSYSCQEITEEVISDLFKGRMDNV